MTTRYTVRPNTRFNVPGLPTGYQNKFTSDVTIPAVGVQDVDRALFRLFNEEIPLTVAGEGTGVKRVPVIFYAGEKWALSKKMRALRDRSGTLILPLLTAVRSSLVQATDQDVTGRGINQQTGEIIVQRKLDRSDRGYQSLVNRLMLQHQTNVAVSPSQGDPGQLTTLRSQGDLVNDPVVQQGGLLLLDRRRNVYETIVIPSPQFFTAVYDVTLWTQYTAHMNQLLEQLIASQLPQGNAWRLETPSGYWFLASVDANTYTADMNADDFSQTERLIKYKFVVKVPGYIFASNVPGAPIPVKRYVSSPTISFSAGLGVGDGSVENSEELLLGADDPTLPIDPGDSAPVRRRDLRATGATRLLPGSTEASSPEDPARTSLPRGTHPARFKKVSGVDRNGRPVETLLRVRSTNKVTGETVLSVDASLGGLSIDVVDD